MNASNFLLFEILLATAKDIPKVASGRKVYMDAGNTRVGTASMEITWATTAIIAKAKLYPRYFLSTIQRHRVLR